MLKLGGRVMDVHFLDLICSLIQMTSTFSQALKKNKKGKNMHELPVVLDIIRVMDEEAKKNKMQKINQINLVIGELSSIIDESVQMYFEIAAKDSPCEGAKLVFEHTRAMLKCQSCGKEFEHEKDFQCPECGGDSILVKGTGREFYIRSFDGQ